MASWWNVLREEINGTIDDFREKGAWGAFKDATLDAVDLVQDAGWLICQCQMLGVEGMKRMQSFRHIQHAFRISSDQSRATTKLRDYVTWTMNIMNRHRFVNLNLFKHRMFALRQGVC